jgi:hypothetical protein
MPHTQQQQQQRLGRATRLLQRRQYEAAAVPRRSMSCVVQQRGRRRLLLSGRRPLLKRHCWLRSSLNCRAILACSFASAAHATRPWVYRRDHCMSPPASEQPARPAREPARNVPRLREPPADGDDVLYEPERRPNSTKVGQSRHRLHVGVCCRAATTMLRQCATSPPPGRVSSTELALLARADVRNGALHTRRRWCGRAG